MVYAKKTLFDEGKGINPVGTSMQKRKNHLGVAQA